MSNEIEMTGDGMRPDDEMRCEKCRYFLPFDASRGVCKERILSFDEQRTSTWGYLEGKSTIGRYVELMGKYDRCTSWERK